MPPLPDLQRLFGLALRTGDAVWAADTIRGDGLAPEQRFQIYLNHVRLTLTEALGATFPVVRALVGEAFFRSAARRFITADLPRRPCLFEYGAGFPAFLGTLPEAAGLSYLADVARLEWAINEAWFAPDAPPLDIAALAALAPEALSEVVLVPHPSCRLVASPWPIEHIWRLHQPEADPADRVDLAEGGVTLFLWRRDEDVVWRSVDPPEAAFLRGLLAGRPLVEAPADPAFCLTGALGRLVADAALAGFHSP